LSIIELPALALPALWTLAAILGTAIICLLLFSLVHRFISVKRAADHRLFLKNLGNVPSVYQLSAESPDSRLKFRFLFQKIPLAEVLLEKSVEKSANAPSSAKRSLAGNTAGAAAQHAEQTGRAVAQKSGMVASFLSAIGSLLPGDAGKAFKQQGAAARQVATKTTQTMGAKNQADRQVKAVTQGASRLGVKPVVNKIGQQSASQHPPVEITVSVFAVAQTAMVPPGQSLPLNLHISSPRKRIPGGSYLYTITSQQVPLEKVDVDIPPVTQQGTVYFPVVSMWRYFFSVFLYVVVTVAALAALVYLLALIWA
jgi:hypothetical protein